MKAPIFVYQPNDLCVFRTLDAAERYVEPFDVVNDEFTYYDSEALQLRANVYKDLRGIERTMIGESDDHKYAESELKKILVDFLSALDHPKQELEKNGFKSSGS